MEITQEIATQIVKVKDLQQFVNSIIEVMVGQSSETINTKQTISKMQEDIHDSIMRGLIPKQWKQTMYGGIPIDFVPISWGKTPEAKTIFEIISKCLGPYNAKNNIDIDTSSIFQEVNKIAVEALFMNFAN